MMPTLLRGEEVHMGRPSTIRPDSGFAKWLYDTREGYGYQKKVLAARSGVGQSTISQLESGERQPSRDMVKRLVAGLLPDGLDSDDSEDLQRRLLSAALAEAFGVEDEYDEDEGLAFYRGLPPEDKDKAYQILKLAFDKEDARDNAGNIGKRAG